MKINKNRAWRKREIFLIQPGTFFFFFLKDSCSRFTPSKSAHLWHVEQMEEAWQKPPAAQICYTGAGSSLCLPKGTGALANAQNSRGWRRKDREKGVSWQQHLPEQPPSLSQTCPAHSSPRALNHCQIPKLLWQFRRRDFLAGVVGTEARGYSVDGVKPFHRWSFWGRCSCVRSFNSFPLIRLDSFHTLFFITPIFCHTCSPTLVFFHFSSLIPFPSEYIFSFLLVSSFFFCLFFFFKFPSLVVSCGGRWMYLFILLVFWGVWLFIWLV